MCVRNLALVLILALFASCTKAKRVSWMTVPTEDSSVSLDLEAYERKYGGYKGVRLEYRHALEHVVSSSAILQDFHWDYLELIENRVLVLDPSEQELTTFELELEPYERLETIKLWVTQPGGQPQMVRSHIPAVTDQDGRKTYKYIYPKIRKGTIIEEKLEIRRDELSEHPPIYHDVPLQFDIPCEKLEVSYRYPDWWQVNVKELAHDKSLPVEHGHDKRNRKRRVSYRAEDVPAIVDEPFSPFFKEMADYLEIMVTSMRMGGVSHKAPSSWSKFGSKFKNSLRERKSWTSSMLAKFTKPMVSESASDLEKLETIISWIQDEIELTKEQPIKEANILIYKKGDALAINGLAQAMLKVVGIASDFLLIHTAENGFFDPNFFGPQLEVPALGVRIPVDGQEQTLVVFPTIDNLPVDHIPAWIQNQSALIVSGRGQNRLIKTPADNRADNAMEEHYQVTLDEEGMVRVVERKILRGSEAFAVRYSLEQLGEKDQDKILDELLTYSEGEVELIKKRFINLEDHKKPLEIELEYRIDNLVTLTPEEVLFNTGGLFSPVSRGKTKVYPGFRRNPIMIPFDVSIVKHICLDYPDSWRLTTELEDVANENALGAVKGRYTFAPGLIQVQQNLSLNQSYEPKERIGDLLAIGGSTSRLDIPTLVFEITP